MKLQPALIFGEYMVLQQGEEIPVWGRSVRDDLVTVTLGENKAQAVAEKGLWCVKLPPMEACTETEMSITSEKTGECICICHVAVGEVWIAAGQSNMEFLLKYDEEAEKLFEEPEDAYLRYFRYPCANYTGCLEQHAYPDDGFWRRWDDRANRGFFSGPAAYMGRELRKVLGVPVGFIGLNWGGTPAAAWTSPEELAANPALKPVLDWQEAILKKADYRTYLEAAHEYTTELPPVEQERMDAFMMGVPMEEIMKTFPPMPMPQGYGPYMEGPLACIRPGGLYENMVKKVAPYAVKGVIWYQGEDDDFRGWQSFYDESMKSMIKSWRKLWKKELPFLQVELAPFEGVGFTGAKAYDVTRHKQRQVTKELPGVYDVCIMDAGHRTNIHVRRKRPVGERLALLARKYVYGEASLAADSPELLSAVREDGQVILSFSHAGDGLKIRGDIHDVLIVKADGRTVQAKVTLREDKMILECPEFALADRIEISYMEMNYCEAALFGRAGLPVSSFTGAV